MFDGGFRLAILGHEKQARGVHKQREKLMSPTIAVIRSLTSAVLVLACSSLLFAKSPSNHAAHDDSTQRVDSVFATCELQVTYRVVLENGKLFVKYRQVINGELTPTARDMFKLYGVVSIQFIRDNRDQISGFVPQNGGARNIRFAKM